MAKHEIIFLGHHDAAIEMQDQVTPAGVKIHCIESPEEDPGFLEREDVSCVVLDEDSYNKKKQSKEKVLKLLKKTKHDFLVISSQSSRSHILEWIQDGARDYIKKPYNPREFLARLHAILTRKVRVVCIGGGTGLFHVLTGIKNIPNLLLTSVVSMADDGGSSGRLRASIGILPPGDVSRSLVALSNAPVLMNHVIQYRFDKAEELSGHTIGNLLLAALVNIKGSMTEAVKSLGDILHVGGIVIPITEKDTTLCASFEDGSVVKGESQIDLCENRPPDLKITKVWHEPEAECDVDAFAMILSADVVVIGPGDLYTSVISNLLVKGIREAIHYTNAKKIYVCNLMTKPGETANYDAMQHIKEIITYLGEDLLDDVIVSNTTLSDKAIREYTKKNQSPVKVGSLEDIRRLTRARMIGADVGHESELVRHDHTKISREIENILSEIKPNHQRIKP